MLDMKVLGDSLIAVVDRNNMRVAFFDVVSEKLFRTIPMSSASSRIAVTGTGRVYLLLSRHEKMFETYSLQNSDNSQYIGILSDDQINNGILLSGMLSAVDEDVVWASSFLPIIVRLDSTGAIVYARKTIEGEVSDPAKLEVASSETTKSTRIKGKRLHGYVVTDSGKLFIHSSLNKVQNSTAVDVYEASNGDYLYSIKIPFYSGYVWMSKNRFYATKDTSAVTGSIDEV